MQSDSSLIRRQNRRRSTDIQRLGETSYFLELNDDGSILCILNGPDETPYAQKKWRIKIQLPKEYPFRSPSVGFMDRIYHPNVDEQSGTICLNALNHEWTPVYNLISIMETLLPQLLTYPNPDDPLNSEAARLLTTDLSAYETRCRSCSGFIES